jgi:RNA polymerase-binding transcription factor
VTSTAHDPVEPLGDVVEQQFGILEQQFQILEEQFQRHTARLSELSICTQQLDRGGYDEETLVALIVSSREALAGTAKALRRMAEGTYGTCERCANGIPLERLEILPHARFCAHCQRADRLTNPPSTSCAPGGAPAADTRRAGRAATAVIQARAVDRADDGT